MKIVINNDYGGFGLSPKARQMLNQLLEIKGKPPCVDSDHADYDRTSEELIRVVEVLKEEANGQCASLQVIEIPDNIEYFIDDYDGLECVREKHRVWNGYESDTGEGGSK